MYRATDTHHQHTHPAVKALFVTGIVAGLIAGVLAFTIVSGGESAACASALTGSPLPIETKTI